MFAHSNFKRCMVISGVIILAHAALSRMGLLAHRSPRAQQPWQMPRSLCDGLKRRCSHELPAARPFGTSPTPLTRQSGRPSVRSARLLASPAVRWPSVRPLVSHQVRPLACSPVRQSSRSPVRLPASPPARPARVLASLAVLRSDHPPTCPTRRPPAHPSIQSPANPVSRPLGRQPAHPSTHLSGCAISIDGLSATDSGLRRSHLSDRLADVARRLRWAQGFTVPTFP